jgi:hypothetical protein
MPYTAELVGAATSAARTGGRMSALRFSGSSDRSNPNNAETSAGLAASTARYASAAPA